MRLHYYTAYNIDLITLLSHCLELDTGSYFLQVNSTWRLKIQLISNWTMNWLPIFDKCSNSLPTGTDDKFGLNWLVWLFHNTRWGWMNGIFTLPLNYWVLERSALSFALLWWEGMAWHNGYLTSLMISEHDSSDGRAVDYNFGGPEFKSPLWIQWDHFY